jgi:hypothetical protein
MATVFVVKNCAFHGRKPFFPDEEPESAAIKKECVLLLTKQYYTITTFPFFNPLLQYLSESH